MKMTVTVRLNGTNANPWHKWGLSQNPFPVIGLAEYDQHLDSIRKLGADPIPDCEHIKKVLKGWSPEFVDLCCRNFKKGEMTNFTVTWEG